MPRIRLMVSGIESRDEALAAVAAGADAVGLDPSVFAEAGLAGNETLADIALALPPGVTPVLITQALTAGTIAQQVDSAAATAVRIERPLPASEYPGLKRIIRGRKIIQSIAVDGPEALTLAASYAAFADGLHLVASDRHLTLCRDIADKTGLPIFLRLVSTQSFPADFQPFAIDVKVPIDMVAIGRLTCGIT